MRRGERGTTLLELTVAMGITTILCAGVFVYLDRESQQVRDIRYQQNMRELANRIQSRAGDPLVLAFSAKYGLSTGNQQLRDCISQVSGKQKVTPCRATNPGRMVPFELIDSWGPNQERLPADQRLARYTLAGSHQHRRFYTLKGEVCPEQKLSPTCQLEASTFFYATCPPDEVTSKPSSAGPNAYKVRADMPQGSCPKAQTITVSFQVVHHPSGARVGGRASRRFPPIPRGAPSAETGISVDVGRIPNPSPVLSHQCPQEHAVLERVEAGRPVCKCPFPFFKRGSGDNFKCVLDPKKCARNERYRGTDSNGVVRCVPVSCRTAKLKEGCDVGGWIEKVTPIAIEQDTMPQGYKNACTATKPCWIGKDGGHCSAPVECAIQVTCCYEVSG